MSQVSLFKKDGHNFVLITILLLLSKQHPKRYSIIFHEKAEAYAEQCKFEGFVDINMWGVSETCVSVAVTDKRKLPDNCMLDPCLHDTFRRNCNK